MILKILKLNDPVLRQPVEKVVDFGHDFQVLIDNMIETMRKNNGIGLAAPQIGESKSVFICEFEGDKEASLPGFPLTVICNPEIIKKSKEERNMVEGCLSFPGLEILIKRPERITIKGLDRYGKPIEIQADSIYARVLQHEFDHLNSTLFIDHLQETRIIFIGTGTLGTRSLELLCQDPQYKVALVITGENNIVSRNQDSKQNPIEMIAQKHKIPLLKTKNINDESIVEKIREAKPSLGIMADFGQIVSQEILNIPKHGIINIHPSLLPLHRGPSPIQQTILEGDKESGVTLILTSAKMDAGDMISQATVELSSAETTTMLKDYLARAGAVLLLNSIPYYLAGDLKPIPQDNNKATYSRLFKKEDGEVNSETDKVTVERKIRAFDQWPKVFIFVDNKRIQLLEAHLNEKEELIIDRVKPEGKNEMTYEEYLRGYKTKLTFS